MRTYGKDQIIVALDVPNATQALTHVLRLREHVGAFKVGLQLFTAEGPAVVREIMEHGGRVFLDLKYHDIPNTVAGVVKSACELGVWMCNVHCSGGSAMMKAAMSVANEYSAEHGRRPLIIGVTVLTSMNAPALEEVGYHKDMPPIELVKRLALLAQSCGLDGVVASPQETTVIRESCGPDFIIVNPGIRPGGSAKGDQARVGTPAVAIRDGADFLVIGRPIIEAEDPAAAADEITRQIIEAFGGVQEA